MNQETLIFPVPQKYSLSGKKQNLSSGKWIILPDNASFRLKNRVMEMARALQKNFLTAPRVAAGKPESGELLLIMCRKRGLGQEGYTLTVEGQGPITLEATEDSGFFYGMQSICQLLRTPSAVPCGKIQDWPSLRERGYMLDISRNENCYTTHDESLVPVDMAGQSY